AGRIEDVVDRGGQLDHAESGTEMTAGHRDRVDRFLTKLVSDLPHLLDLELAQVIRGFDGVEKRGLTKSGHSDIPVLHVGTRGPTRIGDAHFARSEPDWLALAAAQIVQCDFHHRRRLQPVPVNFVELFEVVAPRFRGGTPVPSAHRSKLYTKEP